jgi:hypothetical protein
VGDAPRQSNSATRGRRTDVNAKKKLERKMVSSSITERMKYKKVVME